MKSLIVHVHGAMPPGDLQRLRLEQLLLRNLRGIGLPAEAVETYEWRSGHPTGAAIALGGLALLGGGLIGVGARVAWLCASAGAAGGAAAAYRTARLGIQGAARGLARRLIELQATHEEVHVVAHSMGTDVAVRALGHLQAAGYTLPGAFIACAGTARADRGYDHLTAVAEQGVINVYNPMDLALLAELPVRWAAVIGRSGMRGTGIRNVRTQRGHMDQLPALRHILKASMSESGQEVHPSPA